MIKTTIHIFKKELKHYIYSPIAYVVATVFHGLVGYFFYNSVILYTTRVMNASLSGSEIQGMAFTPTTVIFQGMARSMGTIFVLIVPLITMRLVAEEKRQRTMELFFTSPVSTLSMVLGKYLAALFVYMVVILGTLYMPFLLDMFSDVNWSHVAVAYLGLFLLGAAMVSVGVFASSVTEKQVVSAVMAIGLLVIFWFVGGGIGAASQRITTFLRDVSMYAPFENMMRGLLDLRDVLVLVSYAVFMLFLSIRAIEWSRL
ncbi:MAG: hypothetical protein D6710_09945 [Nitrospirae bacterium]|nr:MAG: hypothetical protein D6710_09945 [Nitrospirota bacterium]